MALNVGVKFETPEEHFLKHKAPPYELPKFNPKDLPQSGDMYKPADAKLTLTQQEVNKLFYVDCYLKQKKKYRDILLCFQKYKII